MLQKFLNFGHDLLFRFPRAGEKKEVRVCAVKPAERIIEDQRYIAVFMFVRLVYDEYGREQEFEFVWFMTNTDVSRNLSSSSFFIGRPPSSIFSGLHTCLLFAAISSSPQYSPLI